LYHVIVITLLYIVILLQQVLVKYKVVNLISYVCSPLFSFVLTCKNSQTLIEFDMKTKDHLEKIFKLVQAGFGSLILT